MSGESDLTRCHSSLHQQTSWTSIDLIMPARGNKGYFHGDPVIFLNDYVARYIATAPNQKEKFWTDFFPDWDEKYPTLNSTEEEELKDEEENYKAEIDTVKQANTEEVAKRGRRKATVQPHPATSERLNELRARAADRGVRYISLS
jgi:transketolase